MNDGGGVSTDGPVARLALACSLAAVGHRDVCTAHCDSFIWHRTCTTSVPIQECQNSKKPKLCSLFWKLLEHLSQLMCSQNAHNFTGNSNVPKNRKNRFSWYPPPPLPPSARLTPCVLVSRTTLKCPLWLFGGPEWNRCPSAHSCCFCPMVSLLFPTTDVENVAQAQWTHYGHNLDQAFWSGTRGRLALEGPVMTKYELPDTHFSPSTSLCTHSYTPPCTATAIQRYTHGPHRRRHTPPYLAPHNHRPGSTGCKYSDNWIPRSSPGNGGLTAEASCYEEAARAGAPTALHPATTPSRAKHVHFV